MSCAEELVVLAEDLARCENFTILQRRYLDWARGRIPGSAFGIYLFRPGRTEVEMCASSGTSDFFLARYEEVGRATDPLLLGVMSYSMIADNLGIMSAPEWIRSPIYRSIYGLHGFGRALQAPIMADGAVVGTLNFGDRAPDGFDATTVDVMGALGRAVGLAVSIARGREQIKHEQRTIRLALELVDQPVIVTDIATGARHLNAAAERVCARIGDGHDLTWFEDLLADAEYCDGVHRASARVIEACGSELAIHVRSFAPDDEPRLRIALMTCHTDAALLVPATMGAMLSRREREIAALVIAGLKDPQIAAQLYLSPYTVKGYVKSTYRKLGVKSRVELTKLLLARSMSGEL